MSGLCRKQEDFLAVDATTTPIPHPGWGGGSLLSRATQVVKSLVAFLRIDCSMLTVDTLPE